MADLRLFGSTSNRVRFTLKDKTTGLPKTGLTGSTSGLIISTVADNEATATAYTQAATHIQTIATLGTFAAPSASNCRFGEVDATNHRGLYEFQFADARFAVSSARRLVISVNDAGSTILDADYEIELVQFDPFDSVRLGLTGLANAVPGAAGGLFIAGANAATSAPTITAHVVGTVDTVTTLSNLPSIPANWLTAAGIAAGALNGKGDWLLSSGYTVPPTVAQIATGLFTDLLAGSDFSTALSFGKLIKDNLDAQASLIKSKTDLIPASPASTTNITAGVITTTTNLTNLPSIPNNWLTAAGIAAAALNGKGDWLASLGAHAPATWIDAASVDAGALDGKGDWLLASSAPANFSAMVIDAAGTVTVLDLAAVADSVQASPSPSTTAFSGSSGLAAVDGFYVGAVLAFTSGTYKGIARRVTTYTSLNRRFGVTALPGIPTAADKFVLLGRIE